MSSHTVCTLHFTGKRNKKKWSRKMRPLSQKLLTGYKAANPKWCEQHISVKLGHHLPSCILFQNTSETEAWTGWPAVLEQSHRYSHVFCTGRADSQPRYCQQKYSLGCPSIFGMASESTLERADSSLFDSSGVCLVKYSPSTPFALAPGDRLSKVT